MFTRNRPGVVALVLALTAAPVAAQTGGAPPTGPQKFAYINSQVILDRAPGRAAAESTFNKEIEGYKTQVQKLGDSLQSLFADFEKNQATMTATARDAKQKELATKQQDYQGRVQQLEQQAQQRQFELVQPMMEQIRTVLEEIRNEGGYAFIFDIAAQGGSVVAYDKNLDLTDRVISRLKPIAIKPAGAGAPAARPDSAKAAPGAVRPAPSGPTRPIRPKL